MEYVQFHPTGMVWPPSVAGMLVTEGVRGEGGILTKADGKRFMFDFIPDNYKAQTADNEEEGLALHSGRQERAPAAGVVDARSRRALHRARDQGRAGDSAWRRVYLDISWIKKRMSNAEEHIKRKLPSMYHQFKALGDVDITKEPMEVGPTTHYIMGGVHVNADTQMSDVPGLFAAGECAAGINGANRLGGNSLSDLIVFGKRAGEFAAKFAKGEFHWQIDNEKIDTYAREALKAVREQRGENPYSVQRDLQEVMQHNVGIVRDESEMRSALDHLKTFWERAAGSVSLGNRDFNPGWHTALDLKNLLTVSEAITRAAWSAKKVAARNSAKIIRKKDERFSKVNTSHSQKRRTARWRFDWRSLRKCQII
jgi:succinate dehydrogenase / fumarate reductase flavoprotein subunit